MIDAVADEAVAVKPQVAFFEALGGYGLTRARAGLRPCPRGGAAGDRRRQARRHRLDRRGVRRGLARTARDGEPPVGDAMTVNPYMGGDSLEPFLAACGDGAGLFVLARTSNPGGADLQELQLADGGLLWERTAALIDALGRALRRVVRPVGRRRGGRGHPPGGGRPGPGADAARRPAAARGGRAGRQRLERCCRRSATIRPAAWSWPRGR